MLDLRDGLGWVQPFRANLGTIHDRVAPIEFERIFEIVQALARRFIAAID